VGGTDWSTAPLGTYPVPQGKYDVQLWVGNAACDGASGIVTIGP
jgi:hypothetical protein